MPDVADRVVGLIEDSGLSRHAFAERVGLDDSKLSKSIGGTRRFSSLDLARIAELCQVTVDWLITGEEPPLAMAARTTSGNAGDAIALAKRYAVMRADLAELGYPQPWKTVTTSPGGGYVEQGRRLANAAAGRLRETGRSAADRDLASSVEGAFGADVAVAGLGSGFDGLAASAAGTKLIVLATSQTPARQRFTLAHELCHLLAGDDQEVHLDRDVFDPRQAKDPSEMRANTFASAFLMPEHSLREAVGPAGLSEGQFAELACDLMVTPSALAYRLLQFRLIDSGNCDRFKRITGATAAKMAGRGDEFAQRVAEGSTSRLPGLLVRDSYSAYESGATTLHPYANLLGVDVDELRAALESEHGIPDAP